MDMKTLRVIEEGKVENIEEINALLDELPSGGYVVNIDGNTTRYIKSNSRCNEAIIPIHFHFWFTFYWLRQPY